MKDKKIKVDIVKCSQVRDKSVEYNSALSSPKCFIELIKPFYSGIDREMLMVIGVNNANIPTIINTVSIGTVNQSICSPRELFKPLILSGSVSFVLVHNHPGGTLTPSSHDDEITKRAYEIGKLMDINLLDHLIVNPDFEYYSYHERRCLSEL